MQSSSNPSLDWRLFFGRQHLPKTLFIVILVATFLWLAFWQLDRLEWRRNLNVEVAAQLSQAPVSLNELSADDDPLMMTDRQVTASGSFDYSQQVVLKNRNQEILGPGVRLVAPYVFPDGDTAVLVDRGWISTGEWEAGGLSQYDESAEAIAGTIRQSEKRPRNATGPETGAELFRIVVADFDQRTAYTLLPIIVEQSGDGSDLNARPYRITQELSLDEGNHLSYAIQWFSFALIFGGGYVYWIWRYQTSLDSK